MEKGNIFWEEKEEDISRRIFFAEEKKNEEEKGGRSSIEERTEQVKENIGRRENYCFLRRRKMKKENS